MGSWSLLLTALRACLVAMAAGDGGDGSAAAPQEQREDSDELLFRLALGLSTCLLVLSCATVLWHRCRGTHDHHHHGPGSRQGEAPAHAAWTTWHGQPGCDPSSPSYTRAGSGRQPQQPQQPQQQQRRGRQQGGQLRSPAMLPGLAAGEGGELPSAGMREGTSSSGRVLV